MSTQFTATLPSVTEWSYFPMGKHQEIKDAFCVTGELPLKQIICPTIQLLPPPISLEDPRGLLAAYQHRQNTAARLLTAAAGLADGSPDLIAEYVSCNVALYGETTSDRFLEAHLFVTERKSCVLSDKWLHEVYMPIWEDFFGKVRHIIGETGETFTHEECAQRFTDAFIALGYPECTGQNKQGGVFETVGTTVMVPILSKTATRTFEQAWRMFCHEGTHAITCATGLRTGNAVLGKGTANYERTQEGLAMLAEAAAEGTFFGTGIARAAERYLVGAIAEGHYGPTRNIATVGYKLTQILSEANPSHPIGTIRQAAFAHLDNAYYRAVAIPSHPAAYYRKLVIYWDALLNVVEWLASHPDPYAGFNFAYSGKFDFTDAYEAQIARDIQIARDTIG